MNGLLTDLDAHVAPACTSVDPSVDGLCLAFGFRKQCQLMGGTAVVGAANKSWYLTRDGEKFGPYSSQELAAMGQEGRITSDMLVWREGMDKWQPASKVKGLLVTPAAPEPPPAPTAPAFTVAVTPAPSASPMPVRGHVTIEKTSKSLKAQQLWGLLCIVLGLMMVGIGASSSQSGSNGPNGIAMVGAPLFLLGVVWRIVTRVRIWWHHG